MLFLLLMLALGAVGGFFSGLLGLGGAILMVPLLLFVPPWFGFHALNMKQVAAISMVQVFFASLSAVIIHNKHNFVSRSLILYMGIPSLVLGFIGAILSKFTRPSALLALFAVISSVAAVLMFIPKYEKNPDQRAEEVEYNRPLAVFLAVVVGFIGGMVGAPGAFIYVPLLLYVLKIPTRVTIGSTLAIVLLTAAAGLVGKLGTHQILIGPAVALVVGAVPAAQWGGAFSRRVNAAILRWVIAVIIVVSTVKIWLQVLHR